MRLLAVIFFLMFTWWLLSGCGFYVGGKTEHEVKGDATVHVVVGVDASACNGVPEERRAECIEALVELAKNASEKDKDKFPGIAGGGE